ncbi:type II secretion system protein [Geomesophilobacter sediminis]|uniref:Type II secretion system protein n=1 Tax=Geomesophilobacter sediminis TaxID=2798584 RepID=A0A8J7JN08_9BACT|nr:type II secretion system protein [Geomesophilobacter sediminis]MBJ6726335.1 type II secretion system protein [Geomesophilobacter sediminis]
MKNILKNRRGLSLIELVVTMVILSILAAMVLPTSQISAKRQKEMVLRRNLREIRTAIDEYKKSYDKAIDEKKINVVINKSGYPESLKKLIEGDDFGGLYNYKKRFLRRIPTDPFNPAKPDENEDKLWRLHSYTDDADSTSWGGEDVYDVSSYSDGTAIDGTKYKDW